MDRAAKYKEAREIEVNLRKYLTQDGNLPTGKRGVKSTSHTDRKDDYHAPEIDLAFRNHGGHLEVMERDVTPAGSHYLLIHFDVPLIDESTFKLQVGGEAAKKELSYTLDEIKSRRKTTQQVMLECGGNGRSLARDRYRSVPWQYQAVGCAKWTGTPLRPFLEASGITSNACEVLFTGADRGVQGQEIQYYQRSLTLAEAMDDDVMLVWEMNGSPLLPAHGAPLRLIVPGWYGFASVKWLIRIDIVVKPFHGFQQLAYMYAMEISDKQGVRMKYNRVRSLFIPPGEPDFYSRTRVVQLGKAVKLRGRAWVGNAEVVKVEFSDDGGKTWHLTALTQRPGPYAWYHWSAAWRPSREGLNWLQCRATDSNGFVQQDQDNELWNCYGMGNNSFHLVPVMVSSNTSTGHLVDFSKL